MFKARVHTGSRSTLNRSGRSAGTADRQTLPVAGWVRIPALLGLLALALPGTSAAQASGTMQVSARVLPATAAWTGVTEAGLAAQSLSQRGFSTPAVRRTGTAFARAERHPADDRRVLVTVHYPRN
jgi:hypothetical protein